MTCRKVAKNSCGTQPTNHDNGVLLLAATCREAMRSGRINFELQNKSTASRQRQRPELHAAILTVESLRTDSKDPPLAPPGGTGRGIILRSIARDGGFTTSILATPKVSAEGENDEKKHNSFWKCAKKPAKLDKLETFASFPRKTKVCNKKQLGQVG